MNQEKERITSLALELKETLGLCNWDLYMELRETCPDDEDGKGDITAEVLSEYRQIHLRVYLRHFLRLTPWGQFTVLVHELLHVILDDFSEEHEGAISALAHLIARLIQGKEEPALIS